MGALLLAALAGGIWHQRSKAQPGIENPSALSGSGTHLAEIEALRKENAALKRQLEAALRASPAPSTAALEPVSPTGAQVPPAPDAPDVDALLTKAQVAFQAKDAQALGDALLALLDAGEAAYPALITLMKDLGNPNNMEWLNNPENRKLIQKFYLGFMTRAPKLGGLVDAILSREGEADGATQFALGMMEMGAQSNLPKDRQAALLLGMLRKATASNDPEMQSMMWQAASALGSLKAKEALPELEKLVLESSDQNRWGLVNAIGGMGGPEAAASLRRILEKNEDDPSRMQLIGMMGPSQDKEITAMLWELLEKEQGQGTRAQLLQALGSRPGSLDRITQQLKSPQLSDQDRQYLLSGLAAGATGSKEQKQAVWNLYESEPAIRDDLLQAMLSHRDPKATQILVDRLRTGQVTDKLAMGFSSLDTKTLKENADALRNLTGNMSTPLPVRTHAFQGLYKVDRPGALNAIMTGFPQLPETERAQVAQYIAYCGGQAEAKAVLAGIASSDPSEQVRQIAGFQR
jgi:HEAT repeat protein